MSISTSARKGVVAAFLGSVVFAALAIPSTATAVVQTKFYSGSPVTTQISAIIPQVVTLKFINSTTSNQSFGSIELTFTSATVQSVSTSISGWSGGPLSTNPSIAKVTSSGAPAVAPGTSIFVYVTVIAPITESTLTIAPVVKQSNDFSGNPGNNFQNTGPATYSVAVVPPPVTLTFDPSPPALVQQSTASATFYMCPAPVVQATADGFPVPGVAVSVAPKSGTGDPGLVGQTTVTTDRSGDATFGNTGCTTGLGATNVGSGYVLEATSATATAPAYSNAFAVDPIVCNTTCTVTTTDGGITSKETANGTGLFGLTAAFEPGKVLGCDSSVSTLSPDPFVETASNDGVSGTITLTFPKVIMNSVPDNGAPHMPVCAGAGLESPFPGSTVVDPSVLGQSLFPIQGLLLDCSDPVYQADILATNADGSLKYPLEMCVSSRARTPGGGEMVVITTNSLSDPRQF